MYLYLSFHISFLEPVCLSETGRLKFYLESGKFFSVKSLHLFMFYVLTFNFEVLVMSMLDHFYLFSSTIFLLL